VEQELLFLLMLPHLLTEHQVPILEDTSLEVVEVLVVLLKHREVMVE
jgi:hypothetical protein